MANVPGLVTDPGKIKGGLVHVPSGGTKIPAYLAQPNQDGNYPGIVVIMEAFGLADHICDLARRFANIGYNAIAPDLYWRDGNPKDPGDFNTVAPVMFGLKDSQAVGDLEASADFLRGLKGATGKVGAIGFCSGGRETYLCACRLGSGSDAAVDCWGGNVVVAKEALTAKKPVAPIDLTPDLTAPLLGLFGNDDSHPTPEQVNRHEAELHRLGKDYEFHRYDGAGHGFFYYHTPMYRPEAAMDGWAKIFGFFGRHLKG